MDGIIPFLKPPGITSHDAVAIVRRLLKEKKVGHSGTLDPLAGGVLPIYMGKATRLIEYGDEYEKTYVAEAIVGISTDTEDVSGRVIGTSLENIQTGISATEAIPLLLSAWKTSENEEYNLTFFKAFERIKQIFLGVTEQIPSSFSAIKVNGVRAYELAREGKDFLLPSRIIDVTQLELLQVSFPYFTVRITCSGGTYIRSLLRDILHNMGYEGTMTHLVRSAVGPFRLENTVTVEEIKEKGEELVLPSEAGVQHFPKMIFSGNEARAISCGKRIEKAMGKPGVYAAYRDNVFFGIVKQEKRFIKADKIIFVQE